MNNQDLITNNTKQITHTPQFEMNIIPNVNKHKRRVQRTPLVINMITAMVVVECDRKGSKPIAA